MRRRVGRVLWGAWLVHALACADPLRSAAPAAEASLAEAPTVAELHWLAGTWVSEDEAGPQTVEHWLGPDGGMMLGVNRTVDGGRAVFFEYLRIEVDDDQIVYLASPRGRQPPTRFALTEHGEGWAAFENPDHDYPQRIEYRRRADRLTMTIAGQQDGEAKSSRWTMRRLEPDPAGGSR